MLLGKASVLKAARGSAGIYGGVEASAQGVCYKESESALSVLYACPPTTMAVQVYLLRSATPRTKRTAMMARTDL